MRPLTYLLMMFFLVSGFSKAAYLMAASTLYVVQVPDPCVSLSSSDLDKVMHVAQKLSAFPITTIYTSDSFSSLQVAEIMNQYFSSQLQVDALLRWEDRESFRKKSSFLREIVLQEFKKTEDCIAVALVHQSLLKMFLRKCLPCFSCVKITGSPQEFRIQVPGEKEKVFRSKQRERDEED